MNSIQPIWGKAKKVVKFAWRHFFTFMMLCILISVFVEGPMKWKNAAIMIAICIFLDWAKQFMKLSRGIDTHIKMHNPHTDIGAPIHIRQWNNPGIMGTGAYDLNRSGIKWDR